MLTTPTAIYRFVDTGSRPVASFTGTPNPASAGAAVAFDASGSYDTDGDIAFYAWDFGDSSTGSGITVLHAFAKPGPYNVSLTVTDNGSSTSSAYRAVVVVGAPGTPPALAMGLAALAVAAVVVVGLLMVSLRRRRRPRRPA